MSDIRCTRTTDIGAYLLGGLPQDEAVALRHHIDGCAECAAAMRELQPLTDQLSTTDLRSFAGMTVETPSDDLRDRILHRAATESDRFGNAPRGSVHKWKVAAASAAVFAVGAGTGWSANLAASPSVPPTTNHVYWGTGTEAAPQKVKFVPAAGAAGVVGPKAWAAVSSGPAGTYAALYTKGLKPNVTYRWWFEKVDGTRVGLGSFVFPAGQSDWVVCPGGTSVERVELKAIGATDPNGVDVLRADLPPPPTAS